MQKLCKFINFSFKSSLKYLQNTKKSEVRGFMMWAFEVSQNLFWRSHFLAGIGISAQIEVSAQFGLLTGISVKVRFSSSMELIEEFKVMSSKLSLHFSKL